MTILRPYALKLAQPQSENIVLPAYGGGLRASNPSNLAAAMHVAVRTIDRYRPRDKLVIVVPPGAEFEDTWAEFVAEFRSDWGSAIRYREKHLFRTMVEEVGLVSGGRIRATAQSKSLEEWLGVNPSRSVTPAELGLLSFLKSRSEGEGARAESRIPRHKLRLCLDPTCMAPTITDSR